MRRPLAHGAGPGQPSPAAGDRRRAGAPRVALAASVLAAGLCAALAPSADAQDDPAYPAATCAALWTAHERTLGPGEDPRAFRDAAVRLADDPSRVDAFVAEQVPLLEELIYAYVDRGDEQSRDLFERLLATCHRFADDHLRTAD